MDAHARPDLHVMFNYGQRADTDFVTNPVVFADIGLVPQMHIPSDPVPGVNNGMRPDDRIVTDYGFKLPSRSAARGQPITQKSSMTTFAPRVTFG